jgi:hypothetical protein
MSKTYGAHRDTYAHHKARAAHCEPFNWGNHCPLHSLSQPNQWQKRELEVQLKFQTQASTLIARSPPRAERCSFYLQADCLMRMHQLCKVTNAPALQSYDHTSNITNLRQHAPLKFSSPAIGLQLMHCANVRFSRTLHKCQQGKQAPAGDMFRRPLRRRHTLFTPSIV